MTEDIYRTLVVRSAGTTKSGSQTTYVCDLEDGDGHKVSFSLIIKGCVGEKHYQAQHAAVAEFCVAGTLLNCGIVYRRRSAGFVMCIDQVMRVQALRLDNNAEIDADTYLNKDRSFWVHTVSTSDWIDIPGVIELHGESCIPIVEDDAPLPLVKYGYGVDYGLLVGKRRSVIQRVWNWAFA